MEDNKESGTLLQNIDTTDEPNILQTMDFNDSYWNKDGTVWKQPPVRIKHGDLVDIEYKGMPFTVLGRYIGKGMGVAKISSGSGIHIGKVICRGLDLNPPLVSDEELFNHIND